jgi:hypothetical protein
MNLDELRKPFPPERVSWRVGSTTKDKSKGMALAYIDSRDVQDRLDEACGPAGWQCRYVPMHDKKTVCEIGIKIDNEWIWKADGAGDSDIEAEKGALSDAFKRAAVKWGVGRYLYDLDSPWVELDTYEKNGATFAKGIKEREYQRLRAMLGGKPTPAPAPSPDTSPQARAAAWVEKASYELLTLRSDAELSAWLQKNNGAVERLRDVDRALYNAINAKIAHRSEELRGKAA